MKNGNPPFFKVDTNLASEGGCQSPTPSTPVSAYVPFTSAENSTPMSPSKEPSSRLPTIATISLAPTTTTTVVTTTTTTTTTFPPLLLKPPPLPRQLDPKEYPLADTPTPPALKRFCFDLNGQPAYIREDEDSEQQIIKLQEALYNMRASSTPTRTVKTSVTSTQQSFNDNYVDTIPSGSGARKRPASPIEPVIDFSVNARHQNSIGKLSRERRSLSPPHKKVRAKSVNSMLEQENELASQRQWMEFTTDFRDNNVNSGITIPRTNTPLSTVQGESSTSIITQQVPTASRPFNTITTSNLGMDTPSTTRSTHSSALPSPSLSPITGVSTSRNTNQFETYFAEHSVRDDVDGDDVTVDEPLSAGINENWNLQQITTTDTSNTPSLWDLNTMLTTFDALPASMKSYMLFQLLRRCPTNTLQYVSNIILPALRKDFVGTLPIELSLHIVRYLDAGSMCRAAQVSKRWRNVIDGDGLTWQRRLKLDGFGVDANEEARAIAENWGFIRPIKSTHNRNRQLDSTNNESGTSSSEERTVVEIDDDDTDNMRVVNEDKESSSDSSGLDMYRNNLNDNMAVDIDISDQKNNSIADNNNELQDSITLSPTGTEFITRQDKGKARADDEWNDFRLEPETHHDDDHPYDGDDSDVDAMSQEGSDHIETSEEKPPLPLSANHPYKAIYRRHFLMRQNWINGRHKHISFQGHGNHVVTCLQFDSEKIISGSDDQCINVYETSTGKLINRLEGHDGGVWALQYVGKTLVSGSTDRTVRVWDLEKGVCTHVFPGHTSTVRCLQIIMPQNVNTNPNEPPIVEPPVPLIVTGSRDSTLKVWQLPNLEKNDPQCQPTIPSSPSDNSQYTDNPYFLRTLQGHSHSVRALAGVGNTLVSGSYDCSVRVWNIMTGECLWRLIGHTQKVYSVVLDAKRKRCMSGSMDGTVKVWSLEDGTIVWTLEGHSSLVGLLDLSHDYLVSAAADSSLRIWNPNDGTCKHVLTTHSGAITCFQHDESKVISGSDGTLRMWDVKTGRQQRDLLTGLSGVWQVKFDERRCVAAVQRNNVTWFDVLDFGVYGIEEDDDLPGGSCTDENGNWVDRRITIGWNGSDD
ncbi:WD40-repeat-containing domain protein [Gigaspora rosea]|uniref:WD40-repeat-containing domain protein n=1 Tax=Gigaspora rosea TaxID=44941 RepID=A0A397VQ66_9GLOM|nr:WD40-repeat-containing domain protein [Gigaspora rosea]